MTTTVRPQLTRDEMIRRIVAAAPEPTDAQIELVRRLVLPVPIAESLSGRS